MFSSKPAWMIGIALYLFSAAHPSGSSLADDAVSQKSLAYFANAADYQNAGAYELAAEEWEKLVKEFPNDPQAKTAWHHLGICNLQQKVPNHQRAIQAFEESLKDEKHELRSETLINLGWAQFAHARKQPAGSPAQTEELKLARSRFGEYLKTSADGMYIDQAVFYIGDIEHLLGNRRKAITYFKQMLDEDRFARSSLRPDALYALGVAFEEEQQLPEADRRYQDFLAQYGSHALANEIRVRRAEILRSSGKLSEAVTVLKQVAVPPDAPADSSTPVSPTPDKSVNTGSPTQVSPMADVALLRLGQILDQQDQPDQAAEYLQKLLTQFPDSKHQVPASLALGKIKLQAGNLDNAVSHFRKVFQGDTDLAADAAHWLSVALMRQEQPAQAAQILTDSLKRFSSSPSLPTLRLDYADALYAMPGRASEARKLYENIAEENADSPLAPRAAYNAAFTALEAGQSDVARQWAERFLTRYPSDPLRSDVAYVAAEALLRNGMHSASAKAFDKLIDADQQNGQVNQWKLRQGMAYYLDGNYVQAAQKMESLIGQLSALDQKAEAQFICGASYLYEEQLDRAIGSLTASHRTSEGWSNADETLLLLAEAHQRNKDNPAARQSYQKLLQSFPQSRLKAQVEYKLAQLAAAEGDLDAAIEQYRRIVADPAASSFHNFATYGVVWSLMQQEQHQQAYEELQPLLTKNLQDSIGSEAVLAEGICLRKLGRWDQAAVALKRFLSRDVQGVSLANGLYELGLTLTELKQLDQANPVFERILADVPDYPATDKVLYEIGWNLFDQDKLTASTERFTELIRKFPQSSHAADAQYMIAQQLYETGKYEPAATGYQAVIEKTREDQLLEKAYYKLGWSQFQMNQFDKAAATFEKQLSAFHSGRLAVDGKFMQAECDFKRDRFEGALAGFELAKKGLQSAQDPSVVSQQIRTLIHLHGAQCLRELKRWDECQQWLDFVIQNYPESPYLPTALYELGFCKQNQGKIDQAITHYGEVANNYRNEVAARARFMLGELYFSQKDHVKAIPEFQRVMYGFGGDKAPDDIKNWQAKSAIEAARCSEALIQSLSGAAKKKVVDTTIEFYEFVLEKHPSHALASQAQSRLGELQKLR